MVPSVATNTVVGSAIAPYAWPTDRSESSSDGLVTPSARRKSVAACLLSPSFTSTSWADDCAAITRCSSGISALHGGQYVAQKLITSGLPAKSARLTFAPTVEVRVKAGALPPPVGGDCSAPTIVVSARSTSGAPQPSPPDASCARPWALSNVTSEGGIS